MNLAGALAISMAALAETPAATEACDAPDIERGEVLVGQARGNPDHLVRTWLPMELMAFHAPLINAGDGALSMLVLGVPSGALVEGELLSAKLDPTKTERDAGYGRFILNPLGNHDGADSLIFLVPALSGADYRTAGRRHDHDLRRLDDGTLFAVDEQGRLTNVIGCVDETCVMHGYTARMSYILVHDHALLRDWARIRDSIETFVRCIQTPPRTP